MPRTLSTAEDRREDVLNAAVKVFAKRGIHGTATLAVAKAAGISQAYLFRLFPTKDELVLAMAQHVSEHLYETFAKAAARAKADGEPVMPAMGAAYLELISDADHLAIQMHAVTASLENAEMREAMRSCFARIYALAIDEGGATPDEAGSFLACGMTLNSLTAMGAMKAGDDDWSGDEPWAQAMLDSVGELH